MPGNNNEEHLLKLVQRIDNTRNVNRFRAYEAGAFCRIWDIPWDVEYQKKSHILLNKLEYQVRKS